LEESCESYNPANLKKFNTISLARLGYSFSKCDPNPIDENIEEEIRDEVDELEDACIKSPVVETSSSNLFDKNMIFELPMSMTDVHRSGSPKKQLI
jgi:hypothetical protein